MKTDLSKFNNSWYKPGNPVKRLLWYCVSAVFFMNPFFPCSWFKIFLLRMFGAQVGKNVNIKPSVNIKYPWKLKIGNNSWLGENVWIDNLEKVTVGNNVCISQGALILTGSHHYRKYTFDLLVHEIVIDDGVWIGAKAVVLQGVHCGSHSILSAGSVTAENLEPYFLYRGNPAVKVKERKIEE